MPLTIRLALPLFVALSFACAGAPAIGDAYEAEPAFVTSSGVIVYSDDPQFLTRDMAETMEDDLLAESRVDPALALQCWLGVRVRVLPVSSWTCATRDARGERVSRTCIGATDGHLNVLLGHAGRCAYDLGSDGPPYEHELAHVLQRCLGRASPDWGHVDPIWPLLSSERPCPQ